jgi:hypothetical protein
LDQKKTIWYKNTIKLPLQSCTFLAFRKCACLCTPLFILYISIILKLLCFIESKNCVLHVKLYQGCRVPSSSFISIGRFSLFKNIVETHLNRKLSQGSPNQANFSPYMHADKEVYKKSKCGYRILFDNFSNFIFLLEDNLRISCTTKKQ